MVEQFAEFKELKNIDKTTMISVLEESFRNVLAKMFGTDENLDVILNPDKGDVQIFQNLEVVPDGEVRDPNLQKEAVYNKFKDLEGELITGEVYQTWSRETLLLDDDKNELLLPKSESIPGDYFRKGETIRAVVASVDNKNNNPKITVSRVNENFLRRLFELEVPEIHDGLISIRAVARIPGERAKIAVESYDDRIDPVGACVGVKGSRIHGIVRELRNENIDVINYTANTALFIQRALSPAHISTIRLDEENRKAEVFLRPEEVSLAIGKNGHNIKLATMLTGYEIDVYRDTEMIYEDDIFLDDFRDEIDAWVIDTLKNCGCVTAKSVLNTPREVLIEKTDLEENTIDEVIEILNKEYEDEEPQQQPEADADSSRQQ